MPVAAVARLRDPEKRRREGLREGWVSVWEEGFVGKWEGECGCV